jgi:hypothetical protein
MWLGDDASNSSALAIAQQLLERQCDFDFVDEQALSSVLIPDKNTLRNLSGQSYRAVIVPSVTAISKAALDRLHAFSKAGGKVLFLGTQPYLVLERSYLRASGPTDLGWAVREPSGELTARVIQALPQPDVQFDRLRPSVKYQHRRWRDADLYFFFNTSAEKQSCQATLAGRGRAQLWDAVSGSINALPDAIAGKGTVRLPMVLEPYETRFIVIGQ